MNFGSRIVKIVQDPAYRFSKLMKLGLYNRLSDRTFLEKAYKAYMGRNLNLDSPKAYTEKLQWLKLYDRRDVYTTMVDKAQAKEYISRKLGTNEYCIETLGVWDHFDEIDFDMLPNQFVLKCTHDSGGIVICKDKTKLDFEKARETIEEGLKRSFFLQTREPQYKNVKPRIIGEPYIEDQSSKELRDYKFFCFDGKARCLFVATDRQVANEPTKFDFFDLNYTHLDIVNGHPNAKKVPEKPLNFELMKELAEILSKGFPHIRVDFYEANGKVYVGELTLHHFSGFEPFVPDQWDYTFGEWLVLPQRSENQ